MGVAREPHCVPGHAGQFIEIILLFSEKNRVLPNQTNML